jgi:hypothetical protein
MLRNRSAPPPCPRRYRATDHSSVASVHRRAVMAVTDRRQRGCHQATAIAPAPSASLPGHGTRNPIVALALSLNNDPDATCAVGHSCQDLPRDIRLIAGDSSRPCRPGRRPGVNAPGRPFTGRVSLRVHVHEPVQRCRQSGRVGEAQVVLRPRWRCEYARACRVIYDVRPRPRLRECEV